MDSIRMAERLYKLLVRPVLFRLDPETAQKLVLAVSGKLDRILPDKPLFRPNDQALLRTNVFGQEFLNPIGLAAGIDKNAKAPGFWHKVGFGFAEFGTITPKPQSGNDLPERLWRLPEYQALANRLGFPSDGAAAVYERIARLNRVGSDFRVAINFGPNRDSSQNELANDYKVLMRKLGRLADFVVINLSSPNTPKLREWQSPARIRIIMDSVRAAADSGQKFPSVLIKISPDLTLSAIEEICAEALSLGIDGLVATNTTLQRERIGVPSQTEGGVSGKPLRCLTLPIIRHIYKFTKGQLPIIGVGGIFSAEDAFDYIQAGASLVEICTGLVYEGPHLAAAINKGLAQLLKQHGFDSVSAAVGTESDPPSRSSHPTLARVA
jgi:dihydroorotate dehydrogenase